MALYQTTILPTDDVALAQRMFTELVNEQPWILFVALGTGPDAELTVQRADRVAYNQSDEGWHVVWARQPAHIEPLLDALRAAPAELKGYLSGCRAFATSLSDVVKDVIRGDDPVPDNVRIMQAFLTAEGGLA